MRERETDMQKEKDWTDRLREKGQKERYTDRQTNWMKDRQTYRRKDRETDRKFNKGERQTGGERQADRQKLHKQKTNVSLFSVYNR